MKYKQITQILGWWIADLSYQKCTQVTENTHFQRDGHHEDAGYYDRDIYFSRVTDDQCQMCYQGCYVQVCKSLVDAQEFVKSRIISSGRREDPWLTNKMIENLYKYNDSRYSDVYNEYQLEKEKEKTKEIQLAAYFEAEKDEFRLDPRAYWKIAELRMEYDKEREFMMESFNSFLTQSSHYHRHFYTKR